MAQATILTLVGSLQAASAANSLNWPSSPHRRNSAAVHLRRPRCAALLQRGPRHREPARGRCRPADPAAAGGPTRRADRHPEYNGTIRPCSRTPSTGSPGPGVRRRSEDKPVAVIGAATSRYGGAWAHDETRRKSRWESPGRVVDHLRCRRRRWTADIRGTIPTW